DDEGEATDLHAGPGTADRSGPEATLRRSDGGDRGTPDGLGGGTRPGDVEEPLPDDSSSSDQLGDRVDHAEGGWETSEAGAGGNAGGGESKAEDGAGGADGSLGDDRPPDGSGGWDSFWEDAFAKISRAIEE